MKVIYNTSFCLKINPPYWAAGVEIYENAGLLRSLAVSAKDRGQGKTVGGGVGVASAIDYTIAHESAEIKREAVPDRIHQKVKNLRSCVRLAQE